MRGSERPRQPEEKEIIKVRLGEPFSFPPVDLSFIEEDYPSEAVIQSFPLKIESIGRGEVRILKDKAVFDGRNSPPRTPAGPVEPLLVMVLIDNLPEEKLETVRCTLLFDEQSFPGVPAYDDTELELEGKAGLMFYEWLDLQTQEACNLYFPHDAEVFKRMRFVVEEKTTP